MTHGQGEFSPAVKRKSVASKRARVESSTTVQPSREMSPGSIGSLVLPPRAPSRVRVVPCRLPVSGRPGCQVTGLAVEGEGDGEVVGGEFFVGRGRV